MVIRPACMDCTENLSTNKIKKNLVSAVNINQLEQKLAQRPLSPLFARLAHEYFSINRVNDAKNLLLKCIDVHPDYSTAYFALAECYLHEQNLPAALEAINHAIHMNPAVATLHQVRNDIQILYDGSGIKDAEKPELQHANSQEAESDIQTDTEIEIPVSALDLPTVDSPTPIEEEIAASTQIKSITAETPILDTVEELSEIPPVEAEDEATAESSITQEITEFLQETEQNNLPTIPAEEIQSSDQDTLIVEGGETTDDSAPVLHEHPEEDQQSSTALEEIPLPTEQMVPDVPEEVPTISQSPIQEEAAIDVPEIGDNAAPEELHASHDRSEEETIIEQESDLTDVSVPASDEKEESVSDYGIEKEESGNELAEPTAQISETTETVTPVESQKDTELQPQPPDDDSRIVSKTLAEIYVSQGEYGEALMIYRLLRHQRPELGDQIDKRIEELERLLHNNPEIPPQV